MFLFTKRTKNIVKWFWIVFASLIIISMVVAYSGFAMLAGTSSSQPHDIPPEVLAELESQQNGTTTPEIRALLEQLQASGTINMATDTADNNTRAATPTEIPEPSEPKTPPVPQLQFDL